MNINRNNLLEESIDKLNKVNLNKEVKITKSKSEKKKVDYGTSKRTSSRVLRA